MSNAPSPTTAEADLAFMRALVDGGRQPGLMAGSGPSIYMVAGLLYGTQCLYHLVEMLTPIRWPPPLTLAVAIGVNVVFFAYLAVVLIRERKLRLGGSAAGRALNAMFGATGLANMGFVIIFALNSIWRHDFTLWLLYPATVFILQGAAWYVAYLMRRKAWMAWTGLGWFASGTALGLLLTNVTAYLAICTAALFLCMALPGWIMIRQSRAQG
jgi:hypothetical protein